jgi:membrane protein
VRPKRFKLLGWTKKAGREFRLVLEILRRFDDDHGFLLSSGITFNLLICFIPLILLLLALAGAYLYSDREVLSHISRYLENAVPSSDPKVMKNILTIIRDRKIVGILGVGGLIWSSTWVFSSLRSALNIVFHVERERGIFRGKAIDLFMILLVGIFLMMSMGLTSMVTLAQSYRFTLFLDMMPILRFILKYLVPYFFTFWMSFLIYKIIPNKRIGFKPALQAAIFTSLLWEIAKQFFGWYVSHLGRFSMVYGSLSTLAIFFLWIYYSSAILLLGGEVAYSLEKEMAKSLPKTFQKKKGGTITPSF